MTNIKSSPDTASLLKEIENLRKMNEQLARSEERYRLMVSSVRDYAIFMLDPEGNIASWNEGARRFKGYEAQDVIGQHFSRFYTEPDIARNHPQFELRMAIEEGRYEEEGLRVRKDGSQFWASVVITRINDKSGNIIGFAKVTRDLTERRKTEESLKSRDEFLSIASHELKTPLTSLLLQLQISVKRITMQASESPIFKELTKSLDISVRQVTSLTDLVNDLLDVSRIQTGVFELNTSEFNLSELVDEIALRFREQLIQAKSELKLHLAPELNGQWDRFRLEQVIVNLISNAIKYAPLAPISISTKLENGRAILEVCDEGPGIEPENINRIFQRFERGNTPSSVGGLGLGLFITKKIVEHHEGSIRVDSAPGRGANFIIELPLIQK